MTRKKVTLSQAMESHPLARAVIQQLGGRAYVVGNAMEAAEHGADAGWSGFTYTAECTEFVRRNKAAIKAAVVQMAEELGEDPVAMVRGFNCLCTRKGSHTGGTVEYDCTASEIGSVLYGDGSDAGEMAGKIYDALAWFALEEVGRAIADLSER